MKSFRALAFLTALLPLVTHCGGSPRPFDQAAWLEAGRDHDQLSVRGDMVDDLMQRHGLPGLSREQLISLLGPPEPHSDAPRDELRYLLEEKYQGLDPDPNELRYLVCHIAASGRVSDCTVSSYRAEG